MKVVPLTLRKANDFVERHHRHSARTSNDGGKFAIGLEVGGELVGAAIVGRPVARMIQQIEGAGTAELLRCCVSDAAPKGASARLMARCKKIWQLMGGTRLVTYTLEHESGASLNGAAASEEKKVRAESWSRQVRPRKPRQLEQVAKKRWAWDLPELPL